MEDELLDVVDVNDTVIGTILRSQMMSLPKDRCVRVVNIFVMNRDGKILVPLRSHDRRLYPNTFDFSCGEHVISGESYDAAAIRGLREELGITITLPPQMIGKLTPKDGINVMAQNYLTYSEGPFDYDTKGIQSLQWMYPQELKRIAEHEPMRCKGHIKETLRVVTFPS